MKKTIFSIIAILVMVASVSAQTDKETKQAAVVKQATDQFAAKLQSIGMHGTTEVSMPGAGQFQVTKPAVVPAKSSKPASSTSGTAQKTSGQRQLQASKVDTLPNGDIIGPNFAVIGGVTYLSDGNGGWVIPGGGQVKQNQQTPAPTANPGNNTGVATATEAIVEPKFGPNGEVLVYNPSTKTWDLPEGLKQAMSAQNSAGGASGGGNGGGSNEDPLLTKKLAPNEIVYDHQGNMVRESTSIKKLQVRRGYDSEGNPTDATVAWMNNRNGGGGLARVATVTGLSVNSYPVVYNQGPVATYGPVGYNGWAQQQFWNQNCFGCR